MKLWTLLENTACREDLHCEHGLSLYIEALGHKILFDAGQSGAFWDNAEKMGVDLSQAEFAVLSHGHYDHGGGLQRFLEGNRHARVYVNQYAFQPHYHGPERYIGLDPALLGSERIVFVDRPVELAPGIILHTCDTLVQPVDAAGLHVLEEGRLQPEDYRHEQYLLIQEPGKTICISGCSHRGIVNIADHFRPDVLVGGFHLMSVTEEARLRATGEALLAYPTRYYTGHCTGEAQLVFLKALMGDRLERISTGMVLEI